MHLTKFNIFTYHLSLKINICYVLLLTRYCYSLEWERRTNKVPLEVRGKVCKGQAVQWNPQS